jgi:hypothetical protein
MQFDARLIGDAATLARTHGELLARLPATVHAFILAELQKWTTLFAPEQRYQRALLEHLSRLTRPELQQAVAGIARVEAEAGSPRIAGGDPGRFQEDAQALLRKRRLLPEWRKEVDGFFQQVDPALEARLYPPDGPRRLVVQLYGSGIAIQADKLWSRFKGTGVRVPLKLEGTQGSVAFLRALFGGRDNGGAGPALFAAARESARLTPLDAWIIEAHEALHDLCDDSAESRADPRPSAAAIRETSGGPLTGLSYDRLRVYRDDLTQALFSKIQSGVESPQAFAAYARSLKIAPGPGALLHAADVLQAFCRDVLLTGNGTLFVNNTFVEWAAVQALRRAQPRILVTRFGVREKLKPFSSLLLFSRPRVSDQIPMIEDPVGSFVDVEQLSYYVWLNAEKSPAYRSKTLYLFLAEGVDEMLAIRSDAPVAPAPALPAASLSDVCASMAEWLGVPVRKSWGQPIAPLVGSHR